MQSKTIRVMMIEDDLNYASLQRDRLAAVKGVRIDVENADRLSMGLVQLLKGGFDVVLLDLHLPDSEGIETFEKVQKKVPDIPIILLTGLDDETVGIKAVQKGAQDYLMKSKADIPILVKSIRYAIERKQTERTIKENEKKYRELSERLEHEMKMQNKLSSVIVHDLRSPVTAVKMANETMMEEGDGLDFDMKLMFMSTIDNESSRMLALINNLLDMYKLKSGEFEIRPEKINLADVIAKSFASLNNIAGEKNISIKLELDNSLPVNADFDRLQQVVFNILSNAIKFTPDNNSITISSQSDNKNVTISCIDSGVGIPKEEIPLIFQEFKQLSSVSTSGEKGTGLGMAITKKLVEAHGGAIWVESEPGKGTTVNFKLPLDIGDTK